MSEYDFALVEDKARLNQKDMNPIVACVALHRIKAYYGSVDLYFGKPELIATDPVSELWTYPFPFLFPQHHHAPHTHTHAN